MILSFGMFQACNSGGRGGEKNSPSTVDQTTAPNTKSQDTTSQKKGMNQNDFNSTRADSSRIKKY